MECDVARSLLLFRRSQPLDLTADDHAELEHHLKDCPDCARSAERYSKFDQTLSVAINGVAIPAELRTNLLRHIQSAQRRILRQHLIRIAALACSIVLLVSLGYGIFLRNRPTLDTYALALDADRTQDDADRAVQAWLADQGLPQQLPLRFNYRLRHTKGLMTIGRSSVPFVEFFAVSPNDSRVESVRVLMIRSSQFSLAELAPAQSSFTNVQIIPESNFHDGIAYVLLFSTPTLDPFLLPPTPIG